MGLFSSFKGLVDGIGESLGFGGHDKIGNRVGQWMNNITGQSDAFNKSNQAEWEFWRANNEYNSPKAVMARYQEANLNPNLIYQGATGGTASGSAPSMSGAGAGAINAILSMYNLRAQNDLLKKQAELTHENAQNTMTQNLVNGRKANLLYYQDKYAEAEYKNFLKTGKIPESYLKSSWSGELTGLLKGLLSKYILG